MAASKSTKKQRRSAPFDIYIFLTATGERFLLKRVYAEMTIREMKCYSELVVGIPSNLQRLQYLDEGDMLDESDLRHNDVVPGATVNLKLWRTWDSLVAAVCKGNAESVFKQDVVISKDWEKLDPVLYKNKMSVCNDRAAVALFISAHRGHSNLIRTLIDDAKADVNMKTPFGRSPLHVAASQGHSSSIDAMLEMGATIDEPDVQGKTPLMVASQCGFKDSERHLFLFQWQTRAAEVKAKAKSTSLLMHQQFDSQFPIWLKGRHAQLYFCQTLPPGEFAGTGLSAPRRTKKNELPPVAKQDEAGDSIGWMNTEQARMQANHRLLSSKSRMSLASSKSSTFEDWLQAKNDKKRQEQTKRREEEARKEKEKQAKTSRSGKTYEDWKQAKQKSKLAVTPEVKKDISLYKDSDDPGYLLEMSFQQWLRKNVDENVLS